MLYVHSRLFSLDGPAGNSKRYAHATAAATARLTKAAHRIVPLVSIAVNAALMPFIISAWRGGLEVDVDATPQRRIRKPRDAGGLVT